MKKVNEIAVINSVSLNEKLYSFNEDNETFRVALRVTYAISNSSDNKEDKDFLSLAAFADAGAVVGKSYSCILNFDRVLEGNKHTEKAQDEALKELSAKFVGKKARFSTFDYTISELTDGKEKSITDGEHTYSSLANTYLGNVDDEQAEVKKLKVRLADMISDNFDYSTDDEDQWGWGLVKQSPKPLFSEKFYVTAQIGCFNIQLLCTLRRCVNLIASITTWKLIS